MLNTKLLASILLVFAVMFAQVGNVAAAPQTQDTTYPQITEIETETDENGTTTVLVTQLLEDQTSETVRISFEYALELGLIDSTTQEPVLPENVPSDTTIDPGKVIEVVPEEELVAPDVHPISMLLAKFFFGSEEDLALTYEMASLIDSYHNGDNDAGVFGFGVIAQALWISKNVSEDGTVDADLAGDILLVKREKSYDDFFTQHPEYLDGYDGPAPTNWGQFKKLLTEKKNNLGVIVSGQEDPASSTDELNQQNRGNGKDKQEQNKPPKKVKKDKKH
jgi:hypothetical protein